MQPVSSMGRTKKYPWNKNYVGVLNGKPTSFKFCSNCVDFHAFSEYTRNSKTSDGMQSNCKSCVRKSNVKSQARRLKTDPAFRTLHNARARIQHALKGRGAKSARTHELLGCSTEAFQAHLDDTLPINATREECHIDHIIPCVAYDLNTPEEQFKCFNYQNQQYLLAVDNLAKSAKLPSIDVLLELKHIWPSDWTIENGVLKTHKNVRNIDLNVHLGRK